MRLNAKKTKSMMVSRSWTNGCSDLTLGGAELEEVKCFRIVGVTSDSKLRIETHLREVVSKAAWSLGVVRRTGKLFDCPRVLKNCFNAYVLPSLEYCAPVSILSAESHLGLLDSTIRSVERLRKDEFCCLGHRRKASALCLL